MKKLLTILIISLSALYVTGCSDSDDTNSNHIKQADHSNDSNGSSNAGDKEQTQPNHEDGSNAGDKEQTQPNHEDGSNAGDKEQTQPNHEDGSNAGDKEQTQPSHEDGSNAGDKEQIQPNHEDGSNAGDKEQTQPETHNIIDPVDVFLHSLIGEYKVELFETNLPQIELDTLSNNCEKVIKQYGGQLPSSEQCIPAVFTLNTFKFEEKNGSILLTIDYNINQNSQYNPYSQIGNHVSLTLRNIKLEKKDNDKYKVVNGDMTIKNSYLSGDFIVNNQNIDTEQNIFSAVFEKKPDGKLYAGFTMDNADANKRVVLKFTAEK